VIRVKTIEIEEFRGIRKLKLDFNSRNFGVCGPNGTGKSGIVDALEFGLTGSISRLSGRGMGLLSVKEHAPHVDSRNRPDKAKVTLTLEVPSLAKTVVISRTVEEASNPSISPNDKEVRALLDQVALHPEFVLSRRELIRYVLSTPGDRASEVQALLRLDEIETVRQALQRIANSTQRELAESREVRDEAARNLARALEIPDVRVERVLGAANKKREHLNLPPLAILTPTSSLRDGLDSIAQRDVQPIVSKQLVRGEIRAAKELLSSFLPEGNRNLTGQLKALQKLAADPLSAQAATREEFLKAALELAVEGECPVCETPWTMEELQQIIKRKLAHFDEVGRSRKEIEKGLSSTASTLSSLDEALTRLISIMKKVDATEAYEALSQFNLSVKRAIGTLRPFLNPANADVALGLILENAADTDADLDKCASLAEALPDESMAEIARDFLTVAQERLEVLRGALQRLKQNDEKAKTAKEVYDTYAEVSTAKLHEIYKQVEESFGDLYRLINKDDEASFTAKLIPSFGKLGFDVDFYNRGHFPPGAYHRAIKMAWGYVYILR